MSESTCENEHLALPWHHRNAQSSTVDMMLRGIIERDKQYFEKKIP
jgi:hypothetical protein